MSKTDNHKPAKPEMVMPVPTVEAIDWKLEDEEKLADATKEIMDYAVERQNSSPIMAKKLTNVKLQACQVLCMCFWYNETLTMKYIDSQKGYDILIKDLIDCLHLFTSDFEKERALYAFNGMCKLEPNLWPQVIFFLDTLGS